ncbi:hypothetical protein ABW21_db0207219 [Orbilia brochopaga]|nr:hypothetical protein ABW21_db0207219 [Drechslerella brochopaga]
MESAANDDDYDHDHDEEYDEEYDYDEEGEGQGLEDYEEFDDEEDLSHRITVSPHVCSTDRSFIGRLPNHLVSEILGYLEQPDILNYSMVSRWCCAAARIVYHRKIRLSNRSVVYLHRHPDIRSEVRQVHYDIGISTGLGEYANTSVGGIASIMATLPKLRLLIITGVRDQTCLLALYRFLRIFDPHPDLRELQIDMGMEALGNNFRWRDLNPSSNGLPNWNWLQQASRPHPKMEKISLGFGPWACGLTRIDLFTEEIVIAHLSTLKILEVKHLAQKDLDVDLPNSVKHHPFHRTPQAISRAIQSAQDLPVVNRSGYKDELNMEHFSKFSSPNLQIFRYYSEVAPPTDDDLKLENVCEVFPNLRELDFVTRASWKRTYANLQLPVPMAQLELISLPGESAGGVGAEFFIDLFDHDNLKEFRLGPPPAHTPSDITKRLVGSVFPHVVKFCWYQRSLQDVTERPWTAMKGEIRFRRLITYTSNLDPIASGHGDKPVGPATTAAVVGTTLGGFGLIMWWGYKQVEYQAVLRNRHKGNGSRMLWSYRS